MRKPKPKRKPKAKAKPETTTKPPTPVEYGGLQEAFDFLNAKLFDNALPQVFFTYQRKATSGGYFSPDRFSTRADDDERLCEISLNPDGFLNKTDEFIVSILGHEMCHLQDFVLGRHPARGYHDKQWAQRMQALGLMPSSTGMVGGKTTGTRMSHYVLPNGLFARMFAALAATGWRLRLQSAPHAGATKAPSSKVKFSCPACTQNAWGKADLAIDCRHCGCKMPAAAAAAA
jgi:predicted SprT family Zn-dependent metalloprotease